MVEVFKTNVADKDEAQRLISELKQLLPEYKINVDLDDCDKVLRIEHTHVPIIQVVSLVRQQGFFCEILE